MKKITTLIFFSLSIQLFAQTSSGALSVYLKGYDTAKQAAETYLNDQKYMMASSKIRSMENSLLKIRNADPSGNHTDKEAEIADLKKRVDAAQSQQTQDRAAANEAYYERINMDNYMNEFVRSAEPDEQTIVNVMKVDPTQIDMEKHKMLVISAADNIDFVEKILRRDLGNGLSSAFDRYESIKQYWEICSGFYPNESRIIAAKGRIFAIEKDLGFSDKASYLAKSEAINEARFSQKQMPVAVRSDAAIEALFKRAFEDQSKRENWSRTLLKINLRNNDWQIVNHKVTGAILGRKQYAAIVFKDNNDGKCKIYTAYELYEQYTGSSYSSTPSPVAQGGCDFFPCENVK